MKTKEPQIVQLKRHNIPEAGIPEHGDQTNQPQGGRAMSVIVRCWVQTFWPRTQKSINIVKLPTTNAECKKARLRMPGADFLNNLGASAHKSASANIAVSTRKRFKKSARTPNFGVGAEEY